jgi:fructokinase
LKKTICVGAGLVALDVILNGSPATLPKLSAGGSCGNVLAILAFLNWDSYPIARLANNRAGDEIVKDLERWNIHLDHLHRNGDGRTPIIIHRIKRDKKGMPVHRFEFRDPETGSWLPQLKPITKNIASEVLQGSLRPDVFYFDRLNPGTFELAKNLKSQGTIIVFEPSSIKDKDQFEQFLEVTDILKYSHQRLPEYRTYYRSPRCFLEIETRGNEGLLYRSENHIDPKSWHVVSGFTLEKMLDTAGAGDWCTAGIVHQLCGGGQKEFFNATAERLNKALCFGSVLGAMNCVYDGARGLMYHYSRERLLSEVERFIANKGIDVNRMPKTPRIDISIQLNFSDLYKITRVSANLV